MRTRPVLSVTGTQDTTGAFNDCRFMRTWSMASTSR
jgi:hypothetical protein